MTAKNILLKLFILLLQFQSASACGWFYTISMHGQEVIKTHDGQLYLYRSFPKDQTLKYLEEAEHSLLLDYNFQKHSDYAMLLSRIGKVKEALEILEKLNAKYPNQYVLMANLGTLYELNGNLEKALYWIQKAMQKNPKSHYGSEWIHVKILEAKLNLKKDANWLKNRAILNLDLSKFQTVPLDRKALDSLEKLESHIAYQLLERIPYTPNPDPIVYQLLMEMVSLVSLDDLYSAHLAASFALIFANNPNEKAQTQAKIQEMETLIAKYGKETPRKNILNEEILYLPDYQVKDFFPKEKPTEDIEEKVPDSNYMWFFIPGVVVLIGLIVWGFRRIGN